MTCSDTNFNGPAAIQISTAKIPPALRQTNSDSQKSDGPTAMQNDTSSDFTQIPTTQIPMAPRQHKVATQIPTGKNLMAPLRYKIMQTPMAWRKFQRPTFRWPKTRWQSSDTSTGATFIIGRSLRKARWQSSGTIIGSWLARCWLAAGWLMAGWLSGNWLAGSWLLGEQLGRVNLS